MGSYSPPNKALWLSSFDKPLSLIDLPIPEATAGTVVVAGGAIMEAADVKVAETVIIGPSGGSFGGLAVELALTLGANVIALGRSEGKQIAMKEKLSNHPRLSYVVTTGDTEADTAAILQATPNGDGADVFNDWTPGSLKTAPFLPAAVGALKRQGRVVLSGGTPGHLEIPYHVLVHKDLKIMGKWMCERNTLKKLITMMESGNLKIGLGSGTALAVFSLEQHQEAVEHAAKNGAWRNYTVIAPNDH
ncbi:isopropanol dehydrogenase [Fusarium albosuccineum]|uniref:Isopropanol dehydrogenase n=1 Tax=Fusarium albosuccineum TaxID=1237068 RepID=A0A8H4LNX1_9HYPO|nr:isopropanol dehydrogenase [Fusarium albosuccineum]